MVQDLQQEYGSSAATRDAVVRGGLVTTLAQVAKAVITVSMHIVLARLLMPEDFGVIAMVAPVLGFIQVVAELGVPQIIIQSPTLRIGDIEALFWRNLKLALVLALCALAASPVMAAIYQEERVLPVMMAMSGLVVLSAGAAPMAALLSRDMRYGALARVEITALLVNAAVTIALAWLGLRYWALFWGQFASSATNLVVLLSISRWRPRHPRAGLDIRHLRQAGGNITTANIANFLNVTVDNLLIGAFLGETALGLYDRAWRLALQPLQMIIMPISRVAIPTLSRLHEDEARYRKAARELLGVLLIACAPPMVFGAAMAHPLIDFLLGARWDALSPVFTWVCFGAVISPVNFMVFWMFMSQGRTREQMRWAMITAVINVSSYVAGLPWGIEGVIAFSAAVTWIVQAPMLIRVIGRSGPVRSLDLMQGIYPFLVAGAAEAAVLKLAAAMTVVSGFVDLAVFTVAGYAVFAGVLMLFPAGRSTIGTLLGALTSRLRKRRAIA